MFCLRYCPHQSCRPLAASCSIRWRRLWSGWWLCSKVVRCKVAYKPIFSRQFDSGALYNWWRYWWRRGKSKRICSDRILCRSSRQLAFAYSACMYIWTADAAFTMLLSGPIETYPPVLSSSGFLSFSVRLTRDAQIIFQKVSCLYHVPTNRKLYLARTITQRSSCPQVPSIFSSVLKLALLWIRTGTWIDVLDDSSPIPHTQNMIRMHVLKLWVNKECSIAFVNSILAVLHIQR